MSSVLKNGRVIVNVRTTGMDYLLSLSVRLSREQQRDFVKEYKERGQGRSSSYALGTAGQWASGLVRPRDASLAFYMDVIQSVISPTQKLELLRLECDEFARNLSIWTTEPSRLDTLTEFFTKACENPLSVVPIFHGVSSEQFPKQQIDDYLLPYVAREVFNVAVVLSKMSLIQRCDDQIDLLRAPKIALYLQHRPTGLCIDVSARSPSRTWSETYRSILPAASLYNASIDVHSINCDATESQARVEEFKALTEKLTDHYCRDLAYSKAEQVSTSVESGEWVMTCAAPYASIAVVERDQRNLRWALLVTGNVLIYLMFTTWWLLVFVVAFAFASMMSSHMNSGVHVRTIEILRERLLVTREKVPMYPETNN